MTSEATAPSVRALFDYLTIEFALRNRGHLAVELNLSKAMINKLYEGRQRMSGKLILHIHEFYGMGVREIRERSGQYD